MEKTKKQIENQEEKLKYLKYELKKNEIKDKLFTIMLILLTLTTTIIIFPIIMTFPVNSSDFLIFAAQVITCFTIIATISKKYDIYLKKQKRKLQSKYKIENNKLNQYIKEYAKRMNKVYTNIPSISYEKNIEIKENDLLNDLRKQRQKLLESQINFKEKKLDKNQTQTQKKYTKTLNKRPNKINKFY